MNEKIIININTKIIDYANKSKIIYLPTLFCGENI